MVQIKNSLIRLELDPLKHVEIQSINVPQLFVEIIYNVYNLSDELIQLTDAVVM